MHKNQQVTKTLSTSDLKDRCKGKTEIHMNFTAQLLWLSKINRQLALSINKTASLFFFVPCVGRV